MSVCFCNYYFHTLDQRKMLVYKYHITWLAGSGMLLMYTHNYPQLELNVYQGQV